MRLDKSSFAVFDDCFYDLEKKGTSGGECWGTYSGTTGSGAGYVNTCIHSGLINDTSGNTVWYNYVAASAGTITGTNNVIVATESICPKGWTLPDKTQITSLVGVDTYVSRFSAVPSGAYSNTVLYSGSVIGSWWGSEVPVDNPGFDRDRLSSNASDGLYLNNERRRSGIAIRCVQAS